MHLINTAVSNVEQGPLTWLIVSALAAAFGLALLGTNGLVSKAFGLVVLFCGVSGLLTIFDVFNYPSIAWFILALLLGLVSLPEIGHTWKTSKIAASIFGIFAFVGLFVAFLLIDNIVELPTGTVGQVFEEGVERMRTIFGMADDGLRQRL